MAVDNARDLLDSQKLAFPIDAWRAKRPSAMCRLGLTDVASVVQATTSQTTDNRQHIYGKPRVLRRIPGGRRSAGADGAASFISIGVLARTFVIPSIT